jgi:sugar/nucleoside kinase (ribokinase family)
MVVVAIGDVMVDWLSLEKGASFDTASHFVRSAGGNSLNTAVALARLGLSSRLVGKIGIDVHGHYLISQLGKEGVDADFLVSDDTYPTANCFAFTNNFGLHSYVEWPKPHAAQMLSADEISDRAFEDAQFLIFTGLSMREKPRSLALLKALSIAQQKQIPTCFDAALPASDKQEDRKLCELPLFQADLLKFNQEELLYWGNNNQTDSSSDNIAQICQGLFAKYQPKLLVATLANQGCYFVAKAGGLSSPGFVVPAIDEVGAGDAFIAGLVFAVVKALGAHSKPDCLDDLSLADWQKIARFANACGAHATLGVGAIEKLPSYAEVEALIALETSLS